MRRPVPVSTPAPPATSARPFRRTAATAIFALVAALLGAPASAQESLTPEAFLDRATGRTLTFVSTPEGRLVGVEQFLSRSRSVYARADGSCAYGTVTVEGPELCFRYEDDPGRAHCWWPFTRGGELHVRIADTASDEVQRVSRIGDGPVLCTDAPAV